jgi:L-methionine (R)-S-oxide reductase
MSVKWRATCQAKKADSGPLPQPMSQSMSQYDELLKKFDVYGRSAGGVKPLMQHISQRLHEEKTRYNWVGFYWMEAPMFDALVLGPYVGSFAPTLRIPLDKGLCGAAATSGQTVVVNQVAADPRYLGSDLVKSNIVVPIFILKDGVTKDAVTKDGMTKDGVKKRVMAELCIESYFADTFTAAEQTFIESCAALVGRYMEKEARTAVESSGTSQ